MFKVSIIIVNYNSKDMLSECLSSIRNNEISVSLEVIVVDNGSIDNSVNKARKLFPEIMVIENATNLGYAKAVNTGIISASGKYLFLINTDIILGNKTIDRMVQFMEKHATVGILSPQLMHPDGRLQNSYYLFPSAVSIFINRSFAHKKGQKKQDHWCVDGVVGAAMMIRKEALKDIGLFDERFFFFFEETDLCKRAHSGGWDVVVLPSVKVTHLQGKTASKDIRAARIEYCRSLYIYAKKHHTVLAYLLLRILYPLKLLCDLMLNFFGVLLTGDRSRPCRMRCVIYSNLCRWHMTGCPDGWGLKKQNTCNL